MDLESQAKLWDCSHRGGAGNTFNGRGYGTGCRIGCVEKEQARFRLSRSGNKPYGKTKHIAHTPEGFGQMGKLLEELRPTTGLEPVVVLEATGHYHRHVVAYLEREDYRHFIVNPLQSKRAKGTHLRKVQTDATDAWHLAEMYYRGDLQPHRTWSEALTELQHLTRQHEFMTSLLVQAKLNARALLDQV